MPAHGAITSLDVAPRDGDSREIKVNSRKVATLLESDVARLGLHLDMPMTESMAQRIAYHHECRLAWRAAIQRLEKSARSERDIREGLQKRGHEDDVVEQVISILAGSGLLDDVRLAASAAESMARRSPASAAFIEARLVRHGISSEEAEKAAVEAAGDPVDAATELAAKSLKSLGSCAPEARVRRIYGRLARRGFDADVITEAMRRINLEIPE
ncbi:MAG: RecX family transcriptional regulator [Phycisphaerales bacterium]|nr:RecX family transcriptional regulator [Phycisphaerales bacterium]